MDSNNFSEGGMRLLLNLEILPYVDDDQIVTIFVKDGELYVLNESKIDIELCYTMGMDNQIKRILKELTVK